MLYYCRMKEKRDKVVIREMELDDLPIVYHLGEELFTASKWPVLYRTWDEYEIMERFLSDREFCLVAEQNKKIVGFVIGTIIEKPKAAWIYGYLLWLGVSPTHQKLGIGNNLINHLTRKFIRDGARIMMIDTASDNETAIRFFKKKGFDNIEEHLYLSKSLVEHPYYRSMKKKGEI